MVKWDAQKEKGFFDAITKALTMSALEVQRIAKLKCPHDIGNLRDHIEIKVQGNKALVGTNVYYAPYIEFGTGKEAEGGKGRKDSWIYYYKGNKGRKGFRKTLGIKGKPFLRPALDETRPYIEKIFTKELKNLK